jgi:hypothetical protein
MNPSAAQGVCSDERHSKSTITSRLQELQSSHPFWNLQPTSYRHSAAQDWNAQLYGAAVFSQLSRVAGSRAAAAHASQTCAHSGHVKSPPAPPDP